MEIYFDVFCGMGKVYFGCQWFVDVVYKFVYMFKVFCYFCC